jgi:hypothetical protein
VSDGTVAAIGVQKAQATDERESGGKSVRHRRAPAAATFVELAPPTAADCVIELEGPRGKLRIQWKGATAADLAGLSRVLWESV